MLLTLFNIVYVLIAVAMAILILLQRGAGAQAGSGFGGGASGTVFGSRGASNFLSRSTAILATVFFLLSLAMAWYLKNAGTLKPSDDLGIMGTVATAPKVTTPAAPPVAGDVPAAPAAGTPVPAANSDVPAATAPAAAAPVKQDDAAAKPTETKPADAKKETPKKQ